MDVRRIWFVPVGAALTVLHQILPAASLRQKRMASLVVANHRSGVCQQDYQGRHGSPEETNQAPGTHTTEISPSPVRFHVYKQANKHVLALGYGWHGAVSVSFQIILPRGGWCYTGLRHYFTFIISRHPTISQRRAGAGITEFEFNACRKQA